MRGYSLPLYPSTIVYINLFHLFHLIFIKQYKKISGTGGWNSPEQVQSAI